VTNNFGKLLSQHFVSTSSRCYCCCCIAAATVAVNVAAVVVDDAVGAAVVAAGSDVDVGYCCALFLLIAGRGKGSFC